MQYWSNLPLYNISLVVAEANHVDVLHKKESQTLCFQIHSEQKDRHFGDPNYNMF